MRKPDVSLILATVGRTDELPRLFDSLAAQTFANFEVIVVDQNTDDRLLPHLERARYLGIAIRHLKHHPANLAAARNAGIEAAKGKWLGFPMTTAGTTRACWKFSRHASPARTSRTASSCAGSSRTNSR